MALTADQVKNNLVTQILQNFPTAEVDTGSVLRDIFVDPQSVQIAALSEELDYISYLSTFVQNASLISEEDLDEIGATYGVVRNDGNIATGSITFRALTRPSENIQIGADDGSGGISVKTLLTEGGNSYEFVTTQTVYMTTSATYNENTGYYEVTAPIKASTSGSDYNLGIGTIKVLVDGISNITGCYNYVPTTGGTDKQSNEEYAISIQDAITGSSKNIESGIDSVLKSVSGVLEVKTLHPNSSEEPTQAGYAISYVRGITETTISDEEFIYVNTTSEYTLSKNPVTRIISVSAYINGERKTLEQGIDYYLFSDVNSIYNDTIYSGDKIIFLRTATGTPDPNTTVTVSYAYNSLIETCQQELNSVLTNYLVLGNLLVAQANQVLIDFSTTIKLKYNYNTEVVKNEILTGISNYITSLPLGGDISQENLFSYISTTFNEYISSIVYPFAVFCKRNDFSTKNELTFTYGEYAGIDENSIKVSFE